VSEKKPLRGETKVVGMLDDAGPWPPLRVHLFASDASAEELRFPENSYSVRDPEEAALAVHSLLANKRAGAQAILVETDHGNTLDPQAVTPFVPPQDPGLAALTDCLVLTEHNDHEGETWRFFVPLNGNEDALDLVEKYVRQVHNRDDYPYEVTHMRVHLGTIKVLANDDGYLPSHTILQRLDFVKVQAKIAHLLRDPTEEDEDEDDEVEGPDYETEDPLYKGGLRKMCADPPSEQDA